MKTTLTRIGDQVRRPILTARSVFETPQVTGLIEDIVNQIRDLRDAIDNGDYKLVMTSKELQSVQLKLAEVEKYVLRPRFREMFSPTRDSTLEQMDKELRDTCWDLEERDWARRNPGYVIKTKEVKVVETVETHSDSLLRV